MRDKPLEDEHIEMVIKGALPHFRKQMPFVHYTTFKAHHQVGIRIKDEETSQPKNPYRKPTQPTQYTRSTKKNLNVNSLRNHK